MGWGTIYPALLGPFKFMPNCSVGPSECETKFTQNILAWAMWKCMVSMAIPYLIFENGGRPTKSIISRVLLIPEH